MAALSAPAVRVSARERLLRAAEALFYEEGFSAVGIDRVIEVAGVAKASLYYCFGSKEELIRAYLLRRQEKRQTRLVEGIAAYQTSRERLLGVFDVVGELFAEPTYRGCAFLKAGAEASVAGCVKEVCDTSRDWMRNFLTDLAQQAGAGEPSLLAEQLMILYDGASVAVQMDGNRGAAATARHIAEMLLDASRVKPRASKKR